jgi:hypothetical protein
MHSELIDAGWHVDIKGNWHSPDPNDARCTFTFDEAWCTHQAERTTDAITHTSDRHDDHPHPPAA